MTAARGNLYRPKHTPSYFAWPRGYLPMSRQVPPGQAKNKYNLIAYPSLFDLRIISHFPLGCIGVRQRGGRSFRGRGTTRVLIWGVVEGGQGPSSASTGSLDPSGGLRSCLGGTGPSLFLSKHGRHYKVLNNYLSAANAGNNCLSNRKNSFSAGPYSASFQLSYMYNVLNRIINISFYVIGSPKNMCYFITLSY